jgi:hypothetical protein
MGAFSRYAISRQRNGTSTQNTNTSPGDGKLPDANDDRVIVFELRSKKPDLPSFSARWDGGNRSVPSSIQYDLDIDLIGAPREAKRFKRGEVGYARHHAIRVGTENKYNVCLKIPVIGLIFDATITFSRHHALTLGATIGNKVTVDTIVNKESILARLWRAIMRYIS